MNQRKHGEPAGDTDISGIFETVIKRVQKPRKPYDKLKIVERQERTRQIQTCSEHIHIGVPNAWLYYSIRNLPEK